MWRRPRMRPPALSGLRGESRFEVAGPWRRPRRRRASVAEGRDAAFGLIRATFRMCRSPGKRSAPGTRTPASAGYWGAVRRGGGPGCGLRPYPGYVEFALQGRGAVATAQASARFKRAGARCGLRPYPGYAELALQGRGAVASVQAASRFNRAEDAAQPRARDSSAWRSIALKVAVRWRPRENCPNFRAHSPVPRIRLTAAKIRLFVSEKSTRLSTQMRAPATAMRPNTTIDTPPITGSGMAWISAPNLGEKPSRMAITAAYTNTAVE